MGLAGALWLVPTDECEQKWHVWPSGQNAKPSRALTLPGTGTHIIRNAGWSISLGPSMITTNRSPCQPMVDLQHEWQIKLPLLNCCIRGFVTVAQLNLSWLIHWAWLEVSLWLLGQKVWLWTSHFFSLGFIFLLMWRLCPERLAC